MKRSISRVRLVAIALVVLLATSGVAGAASTMFTAGAGVTYEADSGLTVTPTVDHGVPSDVFTASDTITLADAEFSADGTASLEVDQFGQSPSGDERTQLSNIDASSNAITIDTDTQSAVTVSGGVTALSFENVALDGTEQLTYSASSSGSITLTGLAASTNWTAVTPSGTVVDSGTTDSSGSATIQVSSASNQDLILLEPNAPTVDSASADPSGGEIVSAKDVTLSINVSDDDFPDDTLEVTFRKDGQSFATKTVTEAGRVSAEADITVGGQVNWSVVVEDQYGATTTSETFDFQTVAQLEIYNESEPSQLVNETTVEVTFFGSNTTVTRSSSNGIIDFAGLPLDQEFVARINAEGYRTRTVEIPSLLQQERAYLLPENTTSVQVRFVLDDVTGTFDEQSVLYIEKPLTVNNSTDYQIIVSDRFGVDGVTTTLEQGVRYELRIRSQDGATAQLSTYDAQLDETVTLQPSAPAVSRPESQAIGYEIAYDNDAQEILVEYVDPAEMTDSLTVSVVSRSGDVLKPNQTYSGANQLSLSIATNGELNETHYVNIHGERGGETIDIRKPVGPKQNDITPPLLDGVWVQVIGAFAILLIGGVFSMLNAGVGAVITSVFGGVLWYFGIMSGLASGSAVALAIGVSTLNLLSQR